MIKTLMLLALLSVTALYGATWYSFDMGLEVVNRLDFFDVESWSSTRIVENSNNYTHPSGISAFHGDHTWIIQSSGRMMVEDDNEDYWLGDGSKIVIEYDEDSDHSGSLYVTTYLGSEDGTAFSAIETSGKASFVENAVLNVTNVTVMDHGELYYENDDIDIGTLKVYEGGYLFHYSESSSVPGDNKYFVNANNGGNGNGTFWLACQGASGIDTGIVWGNVVICIDPEYETSDSLNANGAFASVHGDLTMITWIDGLNNTWDGTYYLMNNGTATHTIDGNLILNHGNLCLKSGSNSADVVVKGNVYFEDMDYTNQLDDYPNLMLSKNGSIKLDVRGDFIMELGEFTATSNKDCTSSLYVDGKIDVQSDADFFRAYNGTSTGKGYLDIVFSNTGGLNRSSDLRLKTGLDRYACKWSITINDYRTISLKSDVEIGTTNHATENRNMIFNVKGTLKMGSYRVKNGSGTYESGNEPKFYLWSLGKIYITDPEGIAASSDTGAIRVTGDRIFDTGGDYYYVGTSAQITGDGLQGANNLEIDNSSGVTLSGDVEAGYLNISQGKFDPDGKDLVVTNTLSVGENGQIEAGATMTVDGYSNAKQYLSIAENDVLISDFSVSSNANGTYFPQRIDRAWIINGTIDGTMGGGKTFTFTWTEEDDNGFTWGGMWPNPVIAPVLYQGSNMMTLWPFYLGSRITSESITELTGSKGVFTIGRSDGEPFDGDPPTLPVELASFTAMVTSGGAIQLTWVTHSEANALGFKVLRSETVDLSSAMTVSPVIPATNTSVMQTYMFQDIEPGPEGFRYYWLNQVAFDGTDIFHGPISLEYYSEDNPAIPGNPLITSLDSPYPNPFNPSVTIAYQLADPAEVGINIYNTRGQLIKTFAVGDKEAGLYRLTWDGLDNSNTACGSGLYLFEMLAGSERFVKKATLLK